MKREDSHGTNATDVRFQIRNQYSITVDPHGGWTCTVSDRWLISRICAHKGTDAGSVTRGCHQQSRVRDAGLSFSVSGRDQFHVEISTSYRMDIRPLSRRRADRPNSSCSHALFRLCFSRISCRLCSHALFRLCFLILAATTRHNHWRIMLAKRGFFMRMLSPMVPMKLLS